LLYPANAKNQTQTLIAATGNKQQLCYFVVEDPATNNPATNKSLLQPVTKDSIVAVQRFGDKQSGDKQLIAAFYFLLYPANAKNLTQMLLDE
jgi:hypothetical protein